LSKLRKQKPEVLKQFYDHAMLNQLQISEEELQSKKDYERSRMDSKLHAILEGDRKKKLASMLSLKKKLQ